jgi:hypothetical protein
MYLVRAYDKTIVLFTHTLAFTQAGDTDLGNGNRWNPIKL